MTRADPDPTRLARGAGSYTGRTMRLLMIGTTSLLLAAGPVDSAAQPDCITIEDFSKSKVGQFPSDWKPRKDAGKDVYIVMEESGLRFLRAVSRELGIQAAKQFEWDLDAYPVLAWSWRPLEFPKGGDERESKTNDSVLAVYLLVPYSRFAGPKAVKYVWSEKVAAGTRLNSNFGLTQARVVRTGAPEKKGEWVEERVPARDDFKRYFDVAETPKPAGIAVLTDSDDTGSTAQGDYTSFRACRR